MLAARYNPGSHELSLEEVAKPEAGYGEVVLKIAAAGICHSDIHVLEVGIGAKGAFTMGHEAAGTAEMIGEGVVGIEQGALYAVHGPNPCGNCVYCRSGRDNLCNAANRAHIGLGVDGAYAEYLRVAARNLIKVPDGVDAAVAAVATDAVLTPYHALKAVGQVKLGETVLIMGLGGLGLNAVQVAKLLGAHVLAVDVNPAKLALAQEMGADETFEAASAPEMLKDRIIDVVADFVGIESTMQQAQLLVRAGGKIVLVGLGTLISPLPLINARVSPGEIQVLGTFWGTSLELREVLTLIAEGKIQPRVETHPLGEVKDWLEKLREGKVSARVAVVP